MTQYSTEKAEIARGLVRRVDDAVRELHAGVSALLHRGTKIFVRLEQDDIGLAFPAVAQGMRLDTKASVEVTVTDKIARTIDQSGLRVAQLDRGRLLVGWDQIISVEDITDPPNDEDDPTAEGGPAV